MVDPYRMVVVNIIASAIVLISTFVYRYIYPKKKINLFALLLIISILPIISILRAGAYESGDFNIHIYRIMSFYDSLMEGNLMPSWAGELNATYGNPLFIFNYSLPYYVVSFFHFIGISFISSMKIYLGLTLYLSGIFMYLFMNKLTNNKLAAFTAAIFYIFSPYHLIDVHFRATLGESTIFLLVPLLFLFIAKYSKKNKFIYLILIILITDLLFLAHPLMALVFLGIAVLYILFTNLRNENLKPMFFQLLSLLGGVIASVYIWAPFIIYAPYMFNFPGSTTINNVLFYPFEQIIFSPWRYGLLFQGPKGELAQIIGYTQVFILIVSIIMIIFRKIPKKIQANYIFWVSLCLLTIFMMTPISNFFWKYIHNTGSMITLYGRLSLAISLFTSIIAGYFAISFSNSKRGRIFIYILVIITIGYTILNWGHRRVIPEINDSVLRKNVWVSTVNEGQTAYFLNTKWADINNFWFSKRPDKPLDVLKGNATVKPIKRTSILHTYDVDAKTALTIRENTLYFPGWTLKNNNKIVNIYPGERGLINANLPAGKQRLELSYEDILIYKLTKIISLTSFLGLFCAIIFYYLFTFLPIHNISPGKRKTQIDFKKKTGLRNFIRYERK